MFLMANSMVNIVLLLIIGVLLRIIIRRTNRRTAKLSEGFTDSSSCNTCGNPVSDCTCQKAATDAINAAASAAVCPPCREQDMSKYVLRSSVPPCPPMPDLSKYMLKTECPPVPDLSNYVLKSSIPRQGPVVLDCSKCNKSKGECPPCPRPRCPEAKCPEPTTCAPCAPCPRASCPVPTVKCRAEENQMDGVRPYLAPLGVSGFGS